MKAPRDPLSPGPYGLGDLGRVVESFDLAWQTATPPAIEAFWEAVQSATPPPGNGSVVLGELIKIDLEYRWRRAAAHAPAESATLASAPLPPSTLPPCPRLEDYASRLPDLGPLAALPRELIAEEYRVRQRWGDRPGHEEYDARFPQAGPALRTQLRRTDAELADEPLGRPPSMDLATEISAMPVPAGMKNPAIELTPARPAVLRTFGDYELIEELSRGGMGVVYKARQCRLDRIVALKVIRSERVGRPEALQRFDREIRAAAKMAHPNIVHIYDADHVDGAPFLAMEFIDGVDLARLVEDKGRLSPALACEYIRQGACGLAHAHERGLVHRDVKPSNLMVARAPGAQPGDVGIVKLLDLGLARLHDGDVAEGSAHLTRDGAVIGTPDFIAPEQVEEPHKADFRADLYSLGCTFYYLLSGSVPFPGGTLVQKLDKHRWQAPPMVQRLRRDVPVEMADIVTRLLAKRPVDRFASANELIAALEHCGRGEKAEPVSFVPSPANAAGGPESPTVLSEEGVPAVVTGPTRRLEGHADGVECVAFSPDGQRLVSAALDGTVRIWDREMATELLRIDVHRGGVLCVAFTPNGRFLVSGGRDKTLCLLDAENGKELNRLTGHTRDINGLTVTPDGHFVVSASSDGSVRLWELKSGKEIRRMGTSARDRHTDAVMFVTVTPNGERVLTGGRDKTMRMWVLESGAEVYRSPPHSGAVYSVAVSPDGKHAVSAGGQSVRQWDLKTGQLLHRYQGHSQPVMSVAFSPDGQRMLSGSRDQTLRLWNVAGQREELRFEGHSNRVMSVAFAPDDGEVLSGSLDRLLGLWKRSG